MDETGALRVCYFGTYRANYPRSRIILAGLRERGVTVFECHERLWQGIDDRVDLASGAWATPSFFWRVLSTYWKLMRKHSMLPDYDVMMIGYPGSLDSIVGKLLSSLRRRPVALDVLMSVHLVAQERGLTRQHPMTGKLIFLLEKFGLRLPDILIAENEVYGTYLQEKYKLAKERFRWLPHGANDKVFSSRNAKTSERPFRVVYHGGYLPSHGLDTIIDAARLLGCHPEVQFDFYGTGPELARIQEISTRERLTNIQFHGFVQTEQLVEAISQADICLGVFGTTRQSLSTIQNKLWEGLAMSATVLSGTSELVAGTLQHREHVFLVERDSPQALANGVLELIANPILRRKIAQQGHDYFVRHHSVAALGARAEAILLELASSQKHVRTRREAS